MGENPSQGQSKIAACKIWALSKTCYVIHHFEQKTMACKIQLLFAIKNAKPKNATCSKCNNHGKKSVL